MRSWHPGYGNSALIDGFGIAFVGLLPSAGGGRHHDFAPCRPCRVRGRRSIKRGPGKRIVEGKSIRLADEVRYIQRRAVDYDSRIVTIGQLILFSTKTGDAWLLDPADQLAARLAREGESEPIQIEETDTTFAIGWKGAAIASRDRRSFTRMRTPAGSPPSSDTPPTSSPRRFDREISNMFG
jgi:hypothetical protein